MHRGCAASVPGGLAGNEVEATSRFVAAAGGRAVIGLLDRIEDMLASRVGTQSALTVPKHCERRSHGGEAMKIIFATDGSECTKKVLAFLVAHECWRG